MSDSLDPALAAGAIGSIVFVAVCWVGLCLFKDCKQHQRALKQSRSDPDLENMITAGPSEERYASPQVPASTVSLRTE